jgi:hypothetical protein
VRVVVGVTKEAPVSELHDISRTCRDCNAAFTITVSEQAWYEARAFHLPSRCRPCRQQARLQRVDGPDYTAAHVDRDRES